MFPCFRHAAARTCSHSLPRSAQLARQAVRWMGAGSDGRRKAPLSAAATGLKWPDRCLKPRPKLFVVRAAQETGRLAAHSLCELSMVFIHRRFRNMNRFPSRPTRSCAKIGLAPGLSIQMTSAIISISGQRTSSAARDKTMSCARRPIQYRRFECSTCVRSSSAARRGSANNDSCRTSLMTFCCSKNSRLGCIPFSPHPVALMVRIRPTFIYTRQDKCISLIAEKRISSPQ